MMSEEVELPPLPALFEHACNVYKEMEAEAVLVSYEDDSEKGSYPQRLIWEGHLTKLFARLRLSVPYYTSVTRQLKRMGCIKQIRRGGGNAPSQWLIVTAPTEELYRDLSTITNNLTKRRLTRLDILEQRVSDMMRDHIKMKEDYALIIEILQDKENKSA